MPPETKLTATSTQQESSVTKVLPFNLSQPAILAIGAFLLIEFMITLVVIFSRMSAGYQFLCVTMLASPVLAVTAISIKHFMAPQRPTSTHTVRSAAVSQPAPQLIPGAQPISRIGAASVSDTEENVLDLVQRLEEIADRTKPLAFSFSMGFDEEEFTYTTLKLKAALVSSPTETAEAPTEPAPVVSKPTIAQSAPKIVEAPPAPKIEPSPVFPPKIKEPVPVAETYQAKPEPPVADIPVATEPPAPAPDSIPAKPAKRVRKAPAPEPEVLAEVQAIVEIKPAEAIEAVSPATIIPKEEPVKPISAPTPIVLAPVVATRAERMKAARNCLRAQNVSGAIELLLQMDEDAEVCDLLGISLEMVGNRQAAIESMLRAIQLDPNRASAHLNYAQLLAREERFQEAIEQAKIALRIKPEYPAARELLASISQVR